MRTFDWIHLKRRPAESALPTAGEEHRGDLRVLSGDGSTTNDALYFGRSRAGTLEFHKITDKVDDTGDSITGAYTITNASTSAALTVDQNGATSASTSVGGAILLENTGNTGAGLVIYSNAGGTATGRLMNIRADNAAFPQAALHIDYDGTANALEVVNNSTDSSSQAFNVVSNNENDSSFTVTGKEVSKGTAKIVHVGKADGSDSSSSAISIDLQTAGTAAQGVYVDATSGTTGDLLKLRNSSVDKFVVDSAGNIETAGTGGVLANYSRNKQTGMFLRPGFLAANTTDVTVPVSNRTLAHYLGVAPFDLTSIILAFNVTTAAVTITWAEVGIGTSATAPVGSTTVDITRAGFTNVAASFNSTGAKTVTVAVTIPAGTHVWALHGSQATTPFVVRGGLGDGVSAGFNQFADATRISTMASPTTFAVTIGSANAAWIAASWS